jgi:hypothetical protein
MKKNVFATTLLFAVSAAASFAANQSPVPFKLTDSGNLSFTSNSSADLAGTGIASHGGKGVSAGVINITGPASCVGGFSARIDGAFTVANGDVIRYTVHQQLCPTDTSGVFAGAGSFTITGGTGGFANASGNGSFNGLGDFGGLKYQCTLDGTICIKACHGSPSRKVVRQLRMRPGYSRSSRHRLAVAGRGRRAPRPPMPNSAERTMA